MNYKIYVVLCGLLLSTGRLQAAEVGAAGGGTAAGLIAAGVALSQQAQAINASPVGAQLAKVAQVGKVSEQQATLQQINRGSATQKEAAPAPVLAAPAPAALTVPPPAPVAAPPPAPAPGGKKDAPLPAVSAVPKPPAVPPKDASVAALAGFVSGKKAGAPKPKTIADDIAAGNAAAAGGGKMGAQIAAANPTGQPMTAEMIRLAANAAKEHGLNRWGNKIIGKDSAISKFMQNHGVGRDMPGSVQVNQNSRLARAGNKLMGADSLAGRLQKAILTRSAKVQNALMGEGSFAARIQGKLMSPDSVLARQWTATSVTGRLANRMMGQKLEYSLKEQQKKVAAFQAAAAQPGGLLVDKMSLKQLGVLKDSMVAVQGNLQQQKEKLSQQIKELKSDTTPDAKAQRKEMREGLKKVESDLANVTTSLARVEPAHQRKELKQQLAQAKKRNKEEPENLADYKALEPPTIPTTATSKDAVGQEIPLPKIPAPTTPIPKDARAQENPLMVAQKLKEQRAAEKLADEKLAEQRAREEKAATTIQALARGSAVRRQVAAQKRVKAEEAAMMASEKEVPVAEMNRGGRVRKMQANDGKAASVASTPVRPPLPKTPPPLPKTPPPLPKDPAP